MIVYELKWSDRRRSYREWLRTKRLASARRAEINKLATKRPYDQITIDASRTRDIPTDKEGLLEWLNKNCGGS